MRILFYLVSIFLVSYTAYASDFTQKTNVFTKKMADYTLISDDPIAGGIIDHLAVDACIAAWGFSQWGWGEKSFHTKSEPWFEYDSPTGGSDKTEHFYMTYLLSRVLSSRFEDRGFSKYKASLYGSMSGLLAMTLLEVGDGTSDYGFSKEDLIADTIGSILAFLIRSNPKVDDFIDIRLEYLPSSGYLKNDGDTTTDYSGMRHLVAFELSGFDALKDTYAQYIEFQLGYYSRGYRSYDNEEKSQHVYAGIGINLSQIARKTDINVSNLPRSSEN
jgi:hypothetical protein